MNKQQHLFLSRQWFKKIINFRRALIYRKNKGRPEGPEMESAIRHMAFHSQNIRDFDKMMNLLQFPENIKRLNLIIPKNKQVWWAEYDHLVFEGNKISGKITEQKEINF